MGFYILSGFYRLHYYLFAYVKLVTLFLYLVLWIQQKDWLIDWTSLSVWLASFIFNVKCAFLVEGITLKSLLFWQTATWKKMGSKLESGGSSWNGFVASIADEFHQKVLLVRALFRFQSCKISLLELKLMKCKICRHRCKCQDSPAVSMSKFRV